ncbi:cytochrome P450 [Sphaerisporangium flaviroseum]|uniref:Cytochrome P450 n=1 Tax=Sphaerisporangium flaviroseum TaxID=509199 RepID=A0ABP7HT06_9ACTN
MLTRDYDSSPSLVHERLRDTYGPVAPVDLLGVPVWLVLGYSEVREILGDQGGIWSKRLANWRDRAEGRIPPEWPLSPAFEVNSSAFQDGAPLRRVRDAWTSALAPFQDHTHVQSQALERAAKKYADDLITVLSEGSGTVGWADLSAQFARPLPLMVINRLLGFESAQGDDVFMDIWRMLDAGPDAAEATHRLLSSVVDLAVTKMRNPGQDFPSYMLAANPDFTVDEMARELIMLPVLTGDVTASLICNTIVEILVNPHVRASLNDGIIEETINRVALVNPPMANLTFRFPTVDVKMGRFVIAAGDPVMVSVAGAHADPAFGAAIDPHAIRSTRAHLAWGVGPHRCQGQRLATRITAIAVSRLFERFSRIRLALPADQLPWRPSPFLRALRSLPVQFELSQAHTPSGNAGSRPISQGRSQAPAPQHQEPPRSALWRFLQGLRRQ